MPLRAFVQELLVICRVVGKWGILSTLLGVVVGSACALFLWSLEQVTHTREQHPWLLYLLPVAGLGIVALYQSVGRGSEAGNNLILEEIHQPGGGVPRRMAPLVLIGTLLTHLCGGSAGREGTAVQMGGSMAAAALRWWPAASLVDRRYLLMAGVAAGFGGVFGTPLAGAIFAMEVLVLGRLHSGALLPCLVASLVSDLTCSHWGIQHTHFAIGSQLPTDALQTVTQLNIPLLLKIVLAGIAFGLASRLFVGLTHGCQWLFRSLIARPLLRPVVGGCLVILLVQLLGTTSYLGLGVTTAEPGGVSITSCFQPGGAQAGSWFWKLLFTAVTLGSGFKGGEVTPLFFIGAALGHTLASLSGAPVDLFAGLGLAGVFAGASNTPVACTIMAIELFGAEYSAHFALCCAVAYLFSGHSGIYHAQRVGTTKTLQADSPHDTSLGEARTQADSH